MRTTILIWVSLALLSFTATAAGADRPVTGDWNGNNTTTIGIVHRDAGSNNLIWRLSNKNAGGAVDVEFPYGNKLTDTVVTGDWDGDNTTTAGVVRPDTESNNLRWLLRNSNSEGSPSLDFLYGAK